MTGKDNEVISWCAEKVLYLDPGGGHISVYINEIASFKVFILYCMYIIPHSSLSSSSVQRI